MIVGIASACLFTHGAWDYPCPCAGSFGSRNACTGDMTRRRDAAQEGVLALWRGWLPSVIGVIPYVGLNFAVYETSKDAILSHYGAPLLDPWR